MKANKNLVSELAEIKNLLASQTMQNDDPVNLDQACNFLGIKKSYLYQLTHKKQIPFYKPNGKMIFFSKNDLRKWLFRNRHKSLQEIQKDSENLMQGLGA